MSKSPIVLVDDLKGGKLTGHMPGDTEYPPPEEDLGGGDICSPEQDPSTEDDKPLD